MLKRFISYYTHIDGTRWVGPDYYAESFMDAQMLAMEYPVQPITVMGEHIKSGLTSENEIESLYHRGADGKIH